MTERVAYEEHMEHTFNAHCMTPLFREAVPYADARLYVVTAPNETLNTDHHIFMEKREIIW